MSGGDEQMQGEGAIAAAAILSQNEPPERDDEGYDSDDPESWGPYYWTDSQIQDGAGAGTKVWHNIKYAGFKSYRATNFAGEVISSFFGLNNSRYQWVIDTMEREKAQKEQIALENSQRKQLQQEEQMRKDRERMESMEAA